MSPDGLVTGELAPVLSSDLDGGDTSFNVISAREQAAVHEVLVVTLCERALLAMTHSRWSQAEALAGEARTVFGPGRGPDELRDTPDLRGPSPRRAAPGRYPGCTAGTHRRSASAASADLRDAPHRHSDPD
jgi:hypothetical protein